jgi:hypothetical protein
MTNVLPTHDSCMSFYFTKENDIHFRFVAVNSVTSEKDFHFVSTSLVKAAHCLYRPRGLYYAKTLQNYHRHTMYISHVVEYQLTSPTW